MRIMPMTPVQARRRNIENALRHAVGIICLVVVLGAAYVAVSIIAQLAAAAMRAAL